MAPTSPPAMIHHWLGRDQAPALSGGHQSAGLPEVEFFEGSLSGAPSLATVAYIKHFFHLVQFVVLELSLRGVMFWPPLASWFLRIYFFFTAPSSDETTESQSLINFPISCKNHSHETPGPRLYTGILMVMKQVSFS